MSIENRKFVLSAIRKIKSIIKSGELGDIYYINANWLNLGLLQPDVNVVFDLVPEGIFNLTFPFIVGTSASPPKTAVPKSIVVLQNKLFFSLSKISCFLIKIKDF